MFDLDDASRLEEWQAVVRMRDDFTEVGRHLVELLAVVVVARDELLVGDRDRSLLGFLFLELWETMQSASHVCAREGPAPQLTVFNERDLRVVLELVETPLEHELGTDPLHLHQVQNHIVGKTKL